MRRRASRQTDAALSLFPFLAVLICTVGALIVLLVVVVQQARVHATAIDSVQENEELIAAQIRQLEHQRQEYMRQIELLQGTRATSKERLAANVEKLFGLDDDMRRLNQAASRLNQTAQQLQQQSSKTRRSITESEKRLADLQRQVHLAKERLKQLAAGGDTGRAAYALIPYDGSSRTQRIPIYVECLEDRVILQPEGITFFKEDFDGVLRPDNPLAAALRANRAYLARAKGLSLDQQAYPLLIVRPDGAESYAAARAAMRSWDAEFGYELVTNDMKLAYPPADPALAQVLRDVVQVTRQRQQRAQLLAAVPSRLSRRDSISGFKASGRGGFVPIERTPRDDRWESGRQPASTAGPYGSRQFGRGGGIRMSQDRVGTGLGADRLGASRPPGQRGPQDPSAGMGTKGGSESGGRRGSASAYGPGDSTGRRSQDQGQNRDSAWVTRHGSAGSGHDASNPHGADYPLMTGSDQGRGPSPGGRGNAYPSHNPSQVPAYGGAGSAPSGAARRDHRGTYSGAYGQAQSDTDGTRPGGAPRSTPNGELGGARGNVASSGQGRGTSSGQSGAAGGSAASGSQSGASGMPGPPGGMQASLGGMAMQAGSTTPLAHSRGPDWALPDSTRGALGITRPITARCLSDRLVLRPEPGSGIRPRVIPVQASTSSAVQPLVDAIWNRVESWGIAGPGVFWKPELHVSVGPNAEGRFAQLQALMKGSGITIVRE